MYTSFAWVVIHRVYLLWELRGFREKFVSDGEVVTGDDGVSRQKGDGDM